MKKHLLWVTSLLLAGSLAIVAWLWLRPVRTIVEAAALSSDELLLFTEGEPRQHWIELHHKEKGPLWESPTGSLEVLSQLGGLPVAYDQEQVFVLLRERSWGDKSGPLILWSIRRRDGARLWEVSLPSSQGASSYGSSLALDGGQLVVAFEEERESAVMAFQSRDGAKQWEARAELSFNEIHVHFTKDTLYLSGAARLWGVSRATGETIQKEERLYHCIIGEELLLLKNHLAPTEEAWLMPLGGGAPTMRAVGVRLPYSAGCGRYKDKLIVIGEAPFLEDEHNPQGPVEEVFGITAIDEKNGGIAWRASLPKGWRGYTLDLQSYSAPRLLRFQPIPVRMGNEHALALLDLERGELRLLPIELSLRADPFRVGDRWIVSELSRVFVLDGNTGRPIDAISFPGGEMPKSARASGDILWGIHRSEESTLTQRPWYRLDLSTGDAQQNGGVELLHPREELRAIFAQ